jgi:hypothetical protein
MSSETLEQVKADRDNLRKFIEHFVRAEVWMENEYDGGSVQDQAEKQGILIQVPHQMPCEEENCGCDGEDVDFLYQFAWTVIPNTNEG